MTPWLVIILLLGNFIMMAFDSREITTGQRVIRVWTQSIADFVQSPVTSITSGVSGYFTSIANLRSAQDENSQLRKEIEELRLDVESAKGLTEENQRLKALLDFKEQSKLDVLPARIIGRDPSVWFDSSIISRGSFDGVKLNMPVVANGALVGRITAVSPLTAQVDLITRDKSGLGAVIGEIGTSTSLGVISGTSKRDLLEMKYVAGSTDVQVGQSVFTTGQDGIYPPGIKVGEIVQVISGSATTPHQIFIQPAAKLGSMQEVGVLLYEPPQRVPFDKQLNPPTKEKK